LVRSWRGRGLSMAERCIDGLVEQNVHLAFALSDYVYVLAEGRLFTEGRPADLAARPEIKQAYLGL
jgi:branched-chain amino acid transport system ATP-binding protein